MRNSYFKFIFEDVVPARIRQENFRKTKKIHVYTKPEKKHSNVSGVISCGKKKVEYLPDALSLDANAHTKEKTELNRTVFFGGFKYLLLFMVALVFAPFVAAAFLG